MTLNTKSWHYKIYQKLSSNPPENICEYLKVFFVHLAFPLVMFICIALLLATLFFLSNSVGLDMFKRFPEFTSYLGSSILSRLFVGITTLIVGGIIVLISSALATMSLCYTASLIEKFFKNKLCVPLKLK